MYLYQERGGSLGCCRPSLRWDYSCILSITSLYRPKRDFSTALKQRYSINATADPTKMPRSPVPESAMGPVYHACDMQGIIMPNAHRKASSAAKPGGRRDERSQISRSYESKLPRRKMKCSVSMMAAKTQDQYPMMPVCGFE